MDIFGYLKNTHKNPKFGKVRQVPTRDPGWDLSKRSLISVEGLGATTTRLAHVVGPSTHSMISSLSNLSILAETFSQSATELFLTFVPLEVHLGQHVNAT